MKLGDKILNYRKKLGLSQEQLGEKVGVSRQTVSKWEIGQTIPELEKMILLAKEFETTIDELIKDEQENIEQDNLNKDKIKGKLIGKVCNKKTAKILIIIFISIIIFLVCKIGYRIILLNGFEKQIREFSHYYYDDIESFEENYRLEISTFNKERGISAAADEMIAFYIKGQKCVKETMINGERYNPIKVEYLDCDTRNYYDIDTVNKKYKKEDFGNLSFKKNLELTNQKDYLINDIMGNIKINGWKDKVKFAFDFDKSISKNGKGKYSINITSDNNIWRMVSISPKSIYYIINSINENDESSGTQIVYNLDLDVVVAEGLTALPDLTGYTEIQ